jgi:hypothetical protein
LGALAAFSGEFIFNPVGLVALSANNANRHSRISVLRNAAATSWLPRFRFREDASNEKQATVFHGESAFPLLPPNGRVRGWR